MGLFNLIKKSQSFTTPPDCYKILVRPDGKVTDYLRSGKKAICRCNKHSKIWEEGDLYESAGGKACNECSYK